MHVAGRLAERGQGVAEGGAFGGGERALDEAALAGHHGAAGPVVAPQPPVSAKSLSALAAR